MTCHIIRLLSETECGACARELPAGLAVATDLIEDPVFVAVCRGCTDGLPDAEHAIQLLESARVQGAARLIPEPPARTV